MSEKRLACEKMQRNRKTNVTMTKRLTPRGEQLASQRPDQWASSHPASRLQAPRGQALTLAQQLPLDERRDWRSCGRPLLSRRPRPDRESEAPSPGAWHGRPPWALGEGAARPDQPWAKGGCRPEGGEIRSDPPLELLSEGRRRRLEADPRGSGQGKTPSPQNHRCPRRHHHLRWGILPQAPPSAWI